MSETGVERDSLLPRTQPPETPDIDIPREGNIIERLDLMPEVKDRRAVFLLTIGIVLFLPLTWYLVLSQDLKALGWFAPHPLLQSLGITAFLLGVIPLQPPTPTSSSLRSARFQLHQRWMIGIMLPAMAIGTFAMWWNKHIHGAKHFTTWHSWFGMTTVVWIVLQSLLGSASVHFGGKLLGGPAKAKKVYKYHRISGYALIALSLATAHLGGAHSTWALTRPGGEMWYVRIGAFWVGAPLLLVGLLMRVRASKMKVM